jgi:hypothetical protein
MMGTVMIRCPRTGEAVSTEINTEAAVFERLPDVPGRMTCSACGEVHVWMARDAWLGNPPLVPQPQVQRVPESEEER